MEHIYTPTPELYDLDTAARIKYHVNTLYPLLNNFARYRFRCNLSLNVVIHPNGQLQILATLVTTHTHYKLTQDISLKNYLAIKYQLKRAIFYNGTTTNAIKYTLWEMSAKALQEGVPEVVYSPSGSSVPLAVSVDLNETVQGIWKVYPFLQAEELLNSFSKDPYEEDVAVSEVLPQITRFAQHNFGCLVFIRVLCTIDGHALLEPTLRCQTDSTAISCNFSVVPENIPQLPNWC